MPTYQYACTACGEESEVVQKFTDDPLTTCEACGGRLRKVFSAVGIVFKGPGFYRTDSRAVKEPAAAAKNGDGAGTKTSSDSASGESSAKSAAKTAAADGSSSSTNGSPVSGSPSAGASSPSKVA